MLGILFTVEVVPRLVEAQEDLEHFLEPVEEILDAEPVEDILEEVAELESGFEPLILSMGEWLNEVLNLFSDTLTQIMSSPALSFFAAFGVFLVAWWLALRFISAGKAG